MIYITGDTHGKFARIEKFCQEFNTTKTDYLIILGDAGINYFGLEDNELKSYLESLPITFLLVYGNHEERPENIKTYKTKNFCNGIVYYEEEYSNILFAKDGEIYNLNNKSVLVIGGAYSVDKEYRLTFGYQWYESEQPSEETKEKILDIVNKNKEVDIVLSHTCPYKYIPREVFLSGIDQSKVDNSTEYFLDEVENKLIYKKWYCGHYHTEKQIDKIEFMFNTIKKFDDKK